jgi:hypothetical protein
MRTITATVRNGRVETDDPIELPEGTRLLVVPADAPEAHADEEHDWDDTPDGVAAWVAQLHALEPFILTDDDRHRIAEARAEQRAWELANFDARADKLRKLWE